MDKGRLEAFSDGVIAVIIITIMMLEMKVPHGAALHVLQAVPGGERVGWVERSDTHQRGAQRYPPLLLAAARVAPHHAVRVPDVGRFPRGERQDGPNRAAALSRRFHKRQPC